MCFHNYTLIILRKALSYSGEREIDSLLNKYIAAQRLNKRIYNSRHNLHNTQKTKKIITIIYSINL